MMFSAACTTNTEVPKASSIIIIPQYGSFYENGLKHGQIMKKEISHQIQNWEQAIKSYLNINRDSMSNIVHKHTNFLGSINLHAPEFLEEINGIADGAEITRELVLLYNLGEEIFNYCTANFESCSNIAFNGMHENTLAYNQDLPEFFHGNGQRIILQHKEHYVFTMPGCIALSGVSTNLAVSCNSLPMLKMNKNALPLPFYIRKLLATKSTNSAKAFVENVPLTIGQNLLMINHEWVVSAEISKNQTKWISVAENEFHAHTNFPIKNDDYKYEIYKKPNCSRYHFMDSIRMELSNNPNVDIPKEINEICAQTPILNKETYLRFIVSFKKNSNPHIEFINPSTKESIFLKF